MSPTDTTCLAWSVFFGFALALWGVLNAFVNLRQAPKLRDGRVFFKNVMDMVVCASIAFLPMLALRFRGTLQETLNPTLWIGLVGLFLIGAAFHYRRAENTRRAFLEQTRA